MSGQPRVHLYVQLPTKSLDIDTSASVFDPESETPEQFVARELLDLVRLVERLYKIEVIPK